MSDNKTLVLIDSSFPFEKIEQFNVDNNILITFDYESHKKLSEEKIKHEISDNFLNDSDLLNIQDESYRFSRWCDEPIIRSSLLYEDHNLGELFYFELRYFFIQFLKKFVEIGNITTKFNQVNFITSNDLYGITKSFTDRVANIYTSKNIQKFIYDSIKINLRIKNMHISFNLPKKYYVKIKLFSEILVNVFFGMRKNFDEGNTILFVEFDISRYDKFFESLSNFNLNTILYSRRRPTIWNLKSFSVMKNSTCKIATSNSLIDKQMKNQIENTIALLLPKINSLWGKESFFNTFFSIKKISFWEAVKPEFIELCRKRMIEGIEEIELAKKLFLKFKFDSVMILSESGFNEQIILKLAKKNNIPVILLQHGLYYDTTEKYLENKFQGIFPFNSNYFAVWGENLKQYALSCGVNEEKIQVLGSPIHDDIFHKKSSHDMAKNKFILLITSGPSKNFVNDLMIETNAKYEQSIEKICKIVTSLDYKLVIKLHPSTFEVDVTELAKKIDPRIEVIKSGNIFDLINSSIIVIVIDMSTVILESQILRKPVISVSVKNYDWGIPTIFASCLRTDVDNIRDLLDKVLKTDDYKEKSNSMGIEYVKKYFSNQGNASKKLLGFLEKLSSKPLSFNEQ